MKEICLALACFLVANVSSAGAEAPKQLGQNSTFSLQTWSPDNANAPTTTSLALRLVQGLALCLGTLFVGLHFYRKFIGGVKVVNGRRLNIVERLSISQKGSLLLVKVDDREMLISTTADSVQLIAEVGSAGGRSFSEHLGSLCKDAEEIEFPLSRAQ